MLKWMLRIAITAIDLALLIALWSVAGWHSPLTWFSCTNAANQAVATVEVDTAQIDLILEITGADEDMSGQ